MKINIKKISNSEVVKPIVTDVFMKFEAPDYSNEGVDTFFKIALNNDDYMNALTIYGAYDDEKLVGVIATREYDSHIALFFVDGNYQKLGIGRKLFNEVCANSKNDFITVNSSPYAVEIYHKLGFKNTNNEQSENGVRYTPMIYRNII